MLTPGNVSDMTAAPALLEHAGRMRDLLGDKGYDAVELRRMARDAGATPFIPGRRNRKRAIRYDKLANNFLSAVALATMISFRL
jgi:IS5 family transposase